MDAGNAAAVSFERKKMNCSNRSKHTPCPEGYLEWFAWAEKKSKTHRQIVCPGCGLYAIWVPKKKKKKVAA